MRGTTITLTAAEQFGDKGPQPGATGFIIGSSRDVDGSIWYQAVFNGHEGYYIVSEDMFE